MRNRHIFLALTTLFSLNAASAVAAESVPAEPAMASGDVVYFQDMKEFEPRAWDDGSHQGGIAYLATALDTLRKEEGDPIVGGFKWWMHHLNSSWIFSSGVYQLRTFLGRPLSRS